MILYVGTVRFWGECLCSRLLFCVLQRKWPLTYDTWDGWISLKNQTMNICGLSSLNCLSVKATPSTTRTTGSAGRLWVAHGCFLSWLMLGGCLTDGSSQPTPVGSVHIDSGASAVTRETHPHRDRPSQHPPIRNQVWRVLSRTKVFFFLYLGERKGIFSQIVH